MPVPARISIVTLGVADLARSRAFYEALGWQRSTASDPSVICWFHTADSALGLFRHDELATDAGLPATEPLPAFRGMTLAINVTSEAAVDEALAEAVAAGGRLVKPAQRAEWGGYAGYFADPDAHLWEVCYNPHFPLDADGALLLPE